MILRKAFPTLLLRLSLSLWAFAGCGNDGGGPGYYSYGYACRDDLDCGAGVGCVERQGGACWPLCRTDVDCAFGYTCKSTPRHGEGGKDDVCIPR